MAYAELAFEGINQSILITGESGSGKTEAAKLLMHHLACIQRGTITSNASFGETVQRILDANPLLESFGNAATERNDNSSRFGKYTILQFDRGVQSNVKNTIRLKGSKSSIYLLEASRICNHSAGERTYHIFYQILAADAKRKRWIWQSLESKTTIDFRYVGMDSRPDMDDAKEFEIVYAALTRIGLREQQILDLLRAVCVVMQLGNIVFFDDPSSDSDRASVQSNAEFEELSSMMGIPASELRNAFTQRTMETRDETFKVPLRAELARQSCDALAKDIYVNTFSWLVKAINTKTSVKNATDIGMIGLLDIFGFESMKENIFGQLCINFTNEKLHQKAMRDIFQVTKEEYESEGIPLAKVGYEDNEEVLAFFEGRTGIIALLNEESFRPKGNDKAFAAKLLDLHKTNSVLLGPRQPRWTEFGIKHYAGTVFYTARNFVESNQDTLPADLKNCAQSSTNPVIASPIEKEDENTNAEAKNSDSLENELVETTGYSPTDFKFSMAKTLDKQFGTAAWMENRSPLAGNKSSAFEASRESEHKMTPKKLHSFDCSGYSPKSSRGRKPSHKAISRSSSGELMGKTVLVKYQDQVADLMAALNQTHSRYVRCIKPNASKTPKHMDNRYTTEQIRCSGIVATVQLTSAIFAKTLSNHLVRLRYHEMWNKEAFPSKARKIERPERKCRLDCEAILACVLNDLIMDHSGKTERLFAVGKTKSYFHKGVLEYLESKRIIELDTVASTIQKRARGMIARSLRLKRTRAIPIIQRWFRKVSKYRRFHQRAQRRRFLEAKGVFELRRTPAQLRAP